MSSSVESSSEQGKSCQTDIDPSASAKRAPAKHLGRGGWQ